MPLKRFHRNKLNKMQKVNTRFQKVNARFEAKDLRHFKDYFSIYDRGNREAWGYSRGNFRKIILTSKVVSALFEVL